MLIHIYLLLIALAFTFFGLALKYGSFGTGAVVMRQSEKDKQKGNPAQPQYLTKLFFTIMSLLLAIVLFFILSSASYDVTIPHCDTYVSSTVLEADNITTTYSHDSGCTYDQYTDETVGDFFVVMAWISVVVLIIFGFKEVAEIVS